MDSFLTDNSVQEDRIIPEIVPGESTPISSASSQAANAINCATSEKPTQSFLTTESSRNCNFTRAKLELQAEVLALNREKEQHKVRLQSLRKELNHVKTTEWLYEPIEKLIGRGNQ